MTDDDLRESCAECDAMKRRYHHYKKSFDSVMMDLVHLRQFADARQGIEKTILRYIQDADRDARRARKAEFERDALKARVNALEEVVRFYADPLSWRNTGIRGDGEYVSETEYRGGKRARAALKEKK